MRTAMRAIAPVAAIIMCGVAAAIPASAQKLNQEQFEDGTGSIGLAPGWQIQHADHGSVTCTGPGGAAVVLKMPWAIMDPSSSVASLPAAAQQPQARPGDLVGALREVMRKQIHGTLKSVRASRAGEVSPGVPSYYLLYTFDLNGKSWTGMGYFAPLVYGGDSPAWQLYSSAVLAPTAQFPKLVKPMLQMWRSWRPNGLPPREGSSSAIFDKILKERQLSQDQIQKEFRENL